MHNTFSTYAQFCQFLDTLGLFHMDLGLERVQKALHSLQLTQLPFYAVQVVGTNGKGSTATFLERLAREHGLRTGLFTSPHFVSPQERIRINGLPLPEERWPVLAQEVHDKAPNLTYFELLTVMAVLAFCKENIDIAIIEAGLGGHYDATTALQRHALCISPISIDHEHVLGKNIEAIAQDKTEAIVSKRPVFTAEQRPQVMNIIEEKCNSRHAPLHKVKLELLPTQQRHTTHSLAHPPIHLLGAHQKANAALALTAWHAIAQEKKVPVNEEKTRYALEEAFIAGRLQYICCQEKTLPSTLLLDGAHNEAGLQKLVDFVQTCEPKPSAIIFSCLADKDQELMRMHLQNLHRLCQHCPLLITGLEHNERALSLEQRQEFVQFLGNTAQNFKNIHEALSYARTHIVHNAQKQGPVLVCGSLYLLGEFYETYPHYLYTKNVMPL